MNFCFRLLPCLALGTLSAMATDTASLRAELIQTETAFCELARTAGIPAAFAQFAAPDAVFFDIDPQEHRGAEAVKLRFEGADPRALLSWKPVTADVAASGELG